MLVLAIAINLNELLQNSCVAAIASLGKLCRVVVVAVNIAVMLVVAILGPEHSRAQTTCKMFHMVFSVECSNI